MPRQEKLLNLGGGGYRELRSRHSIPLHSAWATEQDSISKRIGVCRVVGEGYWSLSKMRIGNLGRWYWQWEIGYI